MNSRRDFLSNLALGLSAMIFTPQIIKPSFRDTLKFNRIKTAALNPAWVDAPFEVACFVYKREDLTGKWKWHSGRYEAKVVQRKTGAPEGSFRPVPTMSEDEFNNLVHKHDGLTIKDPWPMRLDWDKTYIPPYIEQC